MIENKIIALTLKYSCFSTLNMALHVSGITLPRDCADIQVLNLRSFKDPPVIKKPKVAASRSCEVIAERMTVSYFLILSNKSRHVSLFMRK